MLDAQASRAAPPAALPGELVDTVLRAALREDLGGGDLTAAAIAPGARARARLVSKAEGRLAGLAVFARVFELCDPRAEVELQAEDGAAIAPGDVLARVAGNARSLLAAERTALNFVQRMSGIASLTAAFVSACRAAGSAAAVLDTRKTTPGLRAFEKYAVLCGGGANHRFGLWDEAMVKNNHVDLAGRPLDQLVRELRAALGPGVRITAEARTLAEALAGAAGGADVILLDNMGPELLARAAMEVRAAARAQGRAVLVEASGGITLETIGPVAARAGVDRISIGALTHSAPALDLSLYLEPIR